MCPNFLLQQDGARCHTSKYTLTYLYDNVPELLEPEYWTPHSPDLNSLDYCVWLYMEAVVHKNQHVTNISQLKKLIVKEWKSIPQSVIIDAIISFWKRLRMIIEADGGHTYTTSSIGLDLVNRK